MPIKNKQKKAKCDDCDKRAIWVRCTQFAGNHFFCTRCAKKEKDFGKEDSSSFYWEKISDHIKNTR